MLENLIKQDISAQRYKLYQSGSRAFDIFTITSEDDEYLGHIELHDGHINQSHSDIKQGFYKIMFLHILMYGGYSTIYSDTNLSSHAIKAYENLKDWHMLDMKVKTAIGTVNYSKNNLLADRFNIVQIKLAKDSDVFVKEYYERIYRVGSCYHRMLVEKREALNYFLYSDDFLDEKDKNKYVY